MVRIIINLVSLFSICLVVTGYTPQLSKRIVGGQNAKREDFRHQVQLRVIFIANGYNFQETNCGGVIIAPSVVVSAAHCFFKQNYEYRSTLVIAGHTNIDRTHPSQIGNARYPSQIRQASDKVTHPSYRHSVTHYSEHNDIAIVKLNRKFEFNRFVGAIALNTEEVPANIPCFVSGWGDSRRLKATEAHISKSNDRLKFAQVFTIPHQNCARMVPRRLESDSFCAQNRNTWESSCFGDSGGPLTCMNMLVGVVSSGFGGCGFTNAVQTYNDISKQLQFIKENAGQELSLLKYDGINTAANRAQFNRPYNF